MTIRELRKRAGMTQAQSAEYLQIPLRTYKRYEADENKVDRIKYRHIVDRLQDAGKFDEEHGVLTVGQIRQICGEVFGSYSVEYGYLFGSYAKGTATGKSDVDLLVSVPTDGLKFFELLEVLREKLKKKVDLLDAAQLNNNPVLLREILKDGVKIYG